MSRNNRAAVGLTVVLGTALGLGYIGFHCARSAEASRIAITRREAILNAEISELEARIATSRRQGTAIGGRTGNSPWRVTAGKPDSPDSPVPNPKMTALYLAYFRADMARKCRQFYRNLNLSPSQIAAFEDLITAYREEGVNLDAVASADGPDSAPEIAAVRLEEAAEFRTAEIALLGQDGYQELQQFIRVAPAWDFIDDMKIASSLPEPLTIPQEQQLAAILTTSSGTYQNGGPIALDSVDWNAAVAQAQGILSGNQLDGMRAAIDHLELLQLGNQFFQREQKLK